jgi:hypothetical protein
LLLENFSGGAVSLPPRKGFVIGSILDRRGDPDPTPQLPRALEFSDEMDFKEICRLDSRR